jgi:hypothetical protein
MIDDVPILIETLSRPFFPMVRCFYLAVEFDTPDDGWALEIGGERFPLLMLGLTGVVQAAFDGEHFHEPYLIERFIDIVEAKGGLISFEDIWIPKEVFHRAVAVGDVYRVGIALFREAFRFRDSRMSEERFRGIAQEFRNQIEFSPQETGAFRNWSSGTIERIAHEGPKDARFRLERKAER